MTDDEKATRIRAELQAPLQIICDIMTKARNDKIEVHLNIATDQAGRSFINMLKLTKEI